MFAEKIVNNIVLLGAPNAPSGVSLVSILPIIFSHHLFYISKNSPRAVCKTTRVSKIGFACLSLMGNLRLDKN
jgi:hypothetical protein